MRKTYITAAVIAVVLGLWLYSGDHERELIEGSIADNQRAAERVSADSPPTRVRVAVLQASEQPRVVRVRGKTENKRTVTVKAELSGTVVARPVDRGSRVERGDLLCEISAEDRFVALSEAQAGLNQARIEYEGALRLKEKGFNSQSAIAGAKARLASAEATLNRKQLDLKKLRVTAPFAGFVDDVHQEIGDFISPGASCATVIDLNPMLLVGRVSEKDVINLALGQPAQGRLTTGVDVTGPVTFIGQQSDPATRTYPIEIELPNEDWSLRSGLTTEIRIPVEYVLAQQISPAVFSLNDAGSIGVRTIDADNVVEFHEVEILADAADGVWVTGLPPRASVIVVGQELVTPGERVDPVYLSTESMPAKGPAPEGETSGDAPADDSADHSTHPPTFVAQDIGG